MCFPCLIKNQPERGFGTMLGGEVCGGQTVRALVESLIEGFKCSRMVAHRVGAVAFGLGIDSATHYQQKTASFCCGFSVQILN